MSSDLLQLLTGDDQQFARGLVELGWYDYAPVLTDYDFMGKARTALDPQLKAAGEVRETDAWVYRLSLSGGKWQDAVAIVESQLKRDPQFAVVFCNLPGALLILVPSNPDKAFGRAKSGLAVDRIYLDTRRPSNFEAECIRKLKEAPKKHFRARLQEMVNTERVTKKFYDRFKKELDSFQGLIAGITDDADKLWYSSVMLNRLMFIYFLQRKRFLDDDPNYLSHRLKMVQEQRGKGVFQSFYRCFLLRLFHEGLGSRKREPDFEDLLGKIPYLNGGLFEVHDIEGRYVDDVGETVIDIDDDAFESVFSFFDDYEWCLDTRPSRTEREINPDVLGYIFEKYINAIQPGEQKAKGAYYTKEDITGYIAQNTIIPYIFDAAEKKHKAAFEGEESVWTLLQIEPDRYIYDAVQKGVELDLPDDIACGLDDVSKRDKWNTPAPEEYALPTEIWREVVARRKRCAEVRGKLERGEVRSIDDLVTLNLNIVQFARDVIDVTDGPELIRAVWNTMAGKMPEVGTNASPIPPMTVLDPTCGSGAFLFAALNILEPLYEACLDRMQASVVQADSSGDSRKFPDFRSVLARMNDRAKHPNRDYFVLKSIILNNLYGVDIMKEAVEICKLRLFLKMASVVEPDETRDNYGLEPLPDIDFNIRAGNTLVGYATEEEVRGATAEGKTKQLTMMPDGYSAEQMDLIANIDESPTFKRIKDKLAIADSAYEMFRRQQIELGGDVTSEDKQALRAKLSDLDSELNRYLAGQYGIDAAPGKPKFDKWLDSHKPFHWFVEFYGIMKRGGFSVVLGNPPYVEYQKLEDYGLLPGSCRTIDCGNLLAFVSERSVNLSHGTGRIGLVLLVSTFSTERMRPLQELILGTCDSSWISNFAWRPSKLFSGCNTINALWLARRAVTQTAGEVRSTRYIKWQAEERDALFQMLEYGRATAFCIPGCIPKIQSSLAADISDKIRDASTPISSKFHGHSEQNRLFYFRGMLYWIKVLDQLPIQREDGIDTVSVQCKSVLVDPSIPCHCMISVLSSSLFFWFYQTYSDCQQINQREFNGFRVDFSENLVSRLSDLGAALMLDYQANARLVTRRNHTRGVTIEKQYFTINRSKAIIDDIDRVLANHYHLTDEELDFIINYDIKYRMGLNGGDDAEEDE